MQIYLNAGFGEPIGPETLGLIHQLGFAGVRQDIPSADAAARLCPELAETPLNAILLVGGGKMGLTRPGMPPAELVELARRTAGVANRCGLFNRELPAAIELGNEPDIEATYRERPAWFAEQVRVGTEAVRAISSNAVLISGGIANTDKRGLTYLARAIDAGLPAACVIGYHSYRTTASPDTPHKGFTSREEEFQELRRRAGNRPFWCTECGWHTAPSTVKVGLFKRRPVQFTDEQVAAFVAREMRIHAQHGAAVFTLFQLNDGSSPEHMNIGSESGGFQASSSPSDSASVGSRGNSPEDIHPATALERGAVAIRSVSYRSTMRATATTNKYSPAPQTRQYI